MVLSQPWRLDRLAMAFVFLIMGYPMPSYQPQRAPQRGFTLIESLIVVVILGILATIVIPQFSNASHMARENVLKDELRYLRTQVQVYRAQHEDVSPGPTAEAFIQQMTQFTNTQGQVSPTQSAEYPFRYLSKMPTNPINGMSSVTIVGEGEEFSADGLTGWLYQPSSGLVKANQPGEDNDGKAYIAY